MALRTIDRDAKAPLTEDLRLELEDLLREDVRRLRHHIGNGFDGWGIG
jgi:hypothetical protein